MDTVYILSLRNILAMEATESENIFIKQLKDLRMQYETVTKEQVHSSEFGLDNYTQKVLKIFNQVWTCLALLSVDDPLYLPPIYRDETNERITLKFIVELYRRTQSRETFQTGNFILGGLEGTGKTTISKALCLAAGITAKNVLFVYYDLKRSFKLFPTCSQLLNEVLHRLHAKDFQESFGEKDHHAPLLDLCQAVRKVKECAEVTCVGIIYDEIQAIADTRNCPTEVMKNFLKELENFARIYGGMIIGTGSSGDIHSMFFRDFRSKGSKYHSFPDFHRQLCELYYIPALRNTQVLAKYLKDRYDMQRDQQFLSQLLFRTGGIGRLIHNSIITQTISDSLSNLLISSASSAMRNLETGFAFISMFLYLSNHNQIQEILRQNQVPSNFSATFGVDEFNLMTLFRKWHISNYDEKLCSCIEAGLIYVQLVNGKRIVEFSVPQLVLYIFEKEIDPVDTLNLLCSVLMVYFNLSNNGGAPMENYVRKRLNKINAGIFRSVEFLTVSMSSDFVLSTSDLLYLHNKVLLWTDETGIDGWEVVFDPDSSRYFLNYWQNKGGMEEVTIGGGELSTYRNHYKKQGNVSSVNDSDLAGILVKAEVGILTLLFALMKTFPSVHFSIGTLLVTTTKEARLGESLLVKNKSKFTIPKDMVIRFCEVNKIQCPKDLEELNYKVQLFYGTKWFADIVDEPHKIFIPIEPHLSFEKLAVSEKLGSNEDGDTFKFEKPVPMPPVASPPLPPKDVPIESKLKPSAAPITGTSLHNSEINYVRAWGCLEEKKIIDFETLKKLMEDKLGIFEAEDLEGLDPVSCQSIANLLKTSPRNIFLKSLGFP